MICPVCHQENSDDSKFCSKCGHKIPRCPTCGRVINRRGRFCIYDGTQLPEEILSLFPNDQENAAPTDAMAEIAEEIAAAVIEIADESLTEESAAGAMDAVPAEPAEAEQEEPSAVIPEEGIPEEPVPAVPEQPAAVMPEEPATVTEEVPVEEAIEAPIAPNEPRMKFCIQCGRPCEVGQLLCPACRRMAQAQAEPVPVVPPDSGLHQTKFCIECGKPCQIGQVLCEDCKAKKAAVPVVVQKKSHVVPILIAIILVLLIVICAIVGYIAVNGLLNPSRDEADDIDTETISDQRADEDREDVTVPTKDGDEAATVPSETEPASTAAPADETEPVITEPTVAETEPVYVHTYELVKSDLSWEEAKIACEERGGYLATITSQEELDEISELAAASGLTYIWLGASIQSDADDWEDGTWVTGEAWTFDKWYPGEPSKSDIDGTEEHCLCLWNVKYSGEDIGWTFNDQRNDLVGDLPSLSGKVGYICEYEIQVIE